MFKLPLTDPTHNIVKKNVSVPVVILVAVAVGIAWWWQKQGLPGIPGNLAQNLGASPAASSSPVAKAVRSKAKTTQTPAANPNDTNPTYTQLINQYSGGRLIQFDDACHATPGQVAVKTGTKIMLDNRGADAKTIKIDNQTVYLPAYHWQIISASTANALPYNLSLDCRSANTISENSAVINIEATIYKR